MRITRLDKAKDYRIFRNFSWPAASLPEFARFNVIYGWNGAGKTSLSNIFRHIQRKQALKDGQIEILVNQTRVNGADFDKAPLPAVRVFNRDTVDRNVFEAPHQQLPPVFFLGEDSVEKQKRIEELKAQHALQSQGVTRWTQKKADATNVLETFCSEEAKGIKNLLTVAGGGPYNNYNAAHFKAAIQRLAATLPLPERLTDQQRQQHLATKSGKAMEKVAKPSISFPDFTGLVSRTQAILEHSIVSSVIAELAENPALASWVNSGLKLHTGANRSDTCHFCNQPLQEQRTQQLEGHFNDELKRFEAAIDDLIAKIKAAQNFATESRLPPKEALYENLRAEYQQTCTTLSQQTSTVQMALDVLLRGLKAKKDEPFKRLELRQFITSYTSTNEPAGAIETFFQIAYAGMAALSAAMGQAAFDRLTAVIEQHNKHTDVFDIEVETARKALAQDEVLKAFPEWKKKSHAVVTADGHLTTAREQVGRLKTQIDELEIQVRQHRRPAEELNQEIAAYLGRDELRFEVDQNGYRITRGGHPAMHLSDGERTAIAFLYFLKSLEGTDFDLKNGVVVIDDPVSSLDANSLFSAFGFMKQRTAGAGQLFVLTHNFTFFRQVRNWFYNLRGPDKKQARFYMLVTEFIDGKRNSKLNELDPFLHQYESEYHYLFKKVHEEANKAVAPSIEAYYALPNIARRLLEAFLAFRVPDKPGELFQKLESVQFDPAKKTRILRFLHTYSHFDRVAEPDHDLSVLSETPSILEDVLTLIRESDIGHYKKMVELVASPLAQPELSEAN